MRHYSDNPGSVRVDFFKPSGKWYTAEAVDMSDQYHVGDIHLAFKTALVRHLRMGDRLRLDGMTAVCIEPYNVYAHPVMLRVE